MIKKFIFKMIIIIEVTLPSSAKHNVAKYISECELRQCHRDIVYLDIRFMCQFKLKAVYIYERKQSVNFLHDS